ncbi:hypothetical protein C8R46DRAFT_1302595 [Mycena filopes]|nr:hypothetical protein C8R46DRAFT_1302595 [Mycena filopes]
MSQSRPGAMNPGDLARRTTTSLLNKLAAGNFDAIAAQIIALLGNAGNAPTNLTVAQKCIDAGISQPRWTTLYARLYHTISFSPRLGLGVPSFPVVFFRDYLRRMIEQDLKAVPPIGISIDGSTVDIGKRRYLGLSRFLGQMCKVGGGSLGAQVVTVRLAHEHIRMFLREAGSPSQLSLEALCILLETAGPSLDGCSANSRSHMDGYFSRIEEICLSKTIGRRVKFKLQDLCEHRARGWATWEAVEQARFTDRMLLDPEPDEKDLMYGVLVGTVNKFNEILDDLNPGNSFTGTFFDPDSAPHAIRLFVQQTLYSPDSQDIALASTFLQCAAEQDLILTSAMKLGFMLALKDETPLGPDPIHNLRLMLNAAGLGGERGNDIMDQANSHPNTVPNPDFVLVDPSTVTSIFEAISAALCIPPFNSLTPGKFPRSTLEKWMTRISELMVDLATRRDEVLDRNATIDRMSEQIERLSATIELNQSSTRVRDILEAKRNTEHKATVDRLSTQLSTSAEHNEKLTRERDILEKTRNAEQMRRVEMQERLKATELKALKAQEDLRQSREHLLHLEAQLERARQDLQAQKHELQAHQAAEVARSNAAREDGQEAMLTEVMQFLSSRRENARRARQAEEDRINAEKEEKVRREREAARKAERQLGAERERLRCLKRDEKYRNAVQWTDTLALEHFEKVLIIDEFTKFKFSDSAPLSFEALPWPVLNRPGTYGTNHITAPGVRAFFTARVMLIASSEAYPVPGDYRKYLVKQGLLAFHGDKMVSRISTVDNPSFILI